MEQRWTNGPGWALIALGWILSAVPACSSNDGTDTCGTDADCPSGYKCTGGRCVAPASSGCPDGQVPCGSSCFDLLRDPKNCGACGSPCNSGLVCKNGACAIECAAGLTLCGAQCISTQDDANNCGTCGTVCTAGVRCALGICVK